MSIFTMTVGSDDLLPAGKYTAVLTNIEDWEGDYGPVFRLRFAVVHAEETYEVTGWAKKYEKITPKSKMGCWTAAILGRELEENEQLTSQMLLNKPCEIEVAHKAAEDGQIFAKVVTVRQQLPF